MSTPLSRSASGYGASQLVIDEFKRLVKRGRKHLVLSELLQFRPKGPVIPVDMCHIGVLWVLDRCVGGTAAHSLPAAPPAARIQPAR